NRGKPGMQMEHGAWIILAGGIWLHFIGVEQQVEERAIHTTRGLDDPGDVALFGQRIGVAQILTAILTVSLEVPVLSPVNALPLLPTQDGAVLDIKRFLRIVRQFIRTMLAQTHAIFMVDDPLIPVKAEILPVLEPLVHFAGMDEVLEIPLLELTLAE